MTLNDIIEALKVKGLGAVDFMTGETVIESAQLDEDINGSGGLSLSWNSDNGGVIRGATTLLGYVMEKDYVPDLGSDGLYSWSPKWSEPAALLKTIPFGKKVLMLPEPAYDGVVMAVAEESKYLINDSSVYADGDMAIVLHPKEQAKYLWGFMSGEWNAGLGETATAGSVYKDESSGVLWQLTEDTGWICLNETVMYNFAFAGKVSTIVEDMNTFLASIMPGWSIKLHDDDNGSLADTYIVCTFDGTMMKNAIEDVASKANEAYEGKGSVNLYYVGKTIHIGLSNAYAADEYYNRFIVLGGTKNMAKRVPAGNAYAAITQRLSIPQGTYTVNEKNVTVERGSVIDMRADRDVEAPMTRFLVYDNIYPKIDMKILSATPRLCYLLDENGEKIPDGNGYKMYCKWYIQLTLDGESAYVIDTHYIIQDKPLSLLFQSGPLTGREFELVALSGGTYEKEDDDVYDGHTVPASVTEYRIIIKAESDLLLPTLPATYNDGTDMHTFADGGLCPQKDDMVTLVNVAIEDQYKENARKELLEKAYATASLIYSGKKPTYSEERTMPDVITGATGSKSLGVAIGDESDGYIVTGISTDLMTGEQTYSYGTFKPRGILSSTIDKIGSLSLSGGDATFAPLVDVRDEGVEQVIYVGIDNGSGNTSGLTGGTSQSSTTAIRQAGGNTNIKTVYEKVGEVKDEVDEVGKSVNVSELFANLAMALWEACKEEIERLDEDEMNIYISATQPERGRWWYNGTTLYGWSGGSWVQSSEDELAEAFSAIYTHIGEVNFCLYNGRPGSSNKYDIFVVPSTFTSDGVTFEGGIQAWMCIVDGEGATATKKWIPILDSSTAIINNLGSAIQQVVFGGTGNDRDDLLLSSGMLTTKNFVTLFSQAVSKEDGSTITEALFGLGVKYRWEDSQGYHDVEWDGQHWWYDDDGSTTYLNDQDAEDVEPYSLAGLTADVIDFNGKIITLTAQGGLTISGQNLNLQGTSVAVKTSNFTIYGNDGTTALSIFNDDGTKLQLTTDNCEINADLISAIAGDAGLVIKKEGSDGAYIEMGKFDNDTLVAGIKMTKVVAGDFSDQQNYEIGERVYYEEKLYEFTSRHTAGAWNQNEVKEVGMYILDLNANEINLNAERINWLGTSIEEGGETTVVPRQVIPGKFEVDDQGNVTMNNLIANDAMLSGILTSTGSKTAITINATDSSDADTAMKMFALVSNSGIVVEKPVLNVGIEDYIYDDNNTYQEGIIKLFTTDDNHSGRKAILKPQKAVIGGNKYTTIIKPSNYKIYIHDNGEPPLGGYEHNTGEGIEKIYSYLILKIDVLGISRYNLENTTEVYYSKDDFEDRVINTD